VTSARRAVHLVRRFVGSLRPGGPPEADRVWAEGQLRGGEVGLWRAMPAADRRHAVGVARRVDGRLGHDAPRPVLAAALLHDVGKLDAGLGTFGRVAATLVAEVAGPARVAAWDNRFGRYLRHDELGAARLAAAGSDPLTVAWAREHHRPPAAWTLPRAWADALKAADDD